MISKISRRAAIMEAQTSLPSPKRRKPCFFKFLLPDCTDRQLEIPRAFLKHLEGKYCGIVLLKGPSGKIWRVEMAEKNNDVFLRQGWQRFLNENFVKVGYCLVFRYYGRCRFSVKILDTSACERKSMPPVRSHCESINSCHHTEEYITKKKDGSRLNYISQRRPVTEDEINRAYITAKSFKSNNPIAAVIMRKAYVYYGFYMALPQAFVRAALPKMSLPMTLREPISGKEWPAKYIFNEKNRAGALSGGWITFTVANNIEEHDVCVFELIEESKIQVNIIRVLDEIVPLLKFRQRGIKS